jgi:hypothetical protein
MSAHSHMFWLCWRFLGMCALLHVSFRRNDMSAAKSSDIRSAGRLYASNPSSIARRLFGHSNELIGTAISCYFHILCPNLAAKVRVGIVVGYNVGRT